jgi:hypothetical protein
MDLDKLTGDLNDSYNHRFKSVDKRVAHAMNHISDELNVKVNELNLHELKSIATTILDIETKTLKSDVESLLAQKEMIERSLEKKSEELQESKYNVFNAIEVQLKDQQSALSKLHQVKLESIDLYDFLSEMVESAIITALEKDKDGDIRESTEEVIKDITFEAIKEGSLNTIRIRKILSTILYSAVDIAEATPTKAIDRFKKRLSHMPVEAKHILIEDYDTIMEDLNQTDTLFSQVVQTQASENTQEIRKLLLDINKDMHYDLEELVHISKETADIMRDRFSSFAKEAVRKADTALKSEAAQEAKRMGKQAWGVAKTALGSAIKTAKDAIENKEK